MEFLIFCGIFFVIALLYSSVGFGGGSSYLAILALIGIGYPELRVIALACNIVVVTGNCINYYKSGYLKVKKIWPFIVFSVPFAYLGGLLLLEEEVFFIVLAIVLCLIALILIFQASKILKSFHTVYEINNKLFNSIFGGSVGFLSGLVGIGGGIFLAPLLNIINWSSAKIIAATASVFILANSIAGILGVLQRIPDPAVIYPFWGLLLAVFMGGQIGSRLSIYKLKASHVKFLTALLTLFVGLRIFIKYM